MITGRNWILTQLIEYLEDIISSLTAPLRGFCEDDVSDPPDESLYMEAMQLGIDPATLPPGQLQQAIKDRKASIKNRQNPS